MLLKISVPSATAIDMSYQGASKGKEAPEITWTSRKKMSPGRKMQQHCKRTTAQRFLFRKLKPEPGKSVNANPSFAHIKLNLALQGLVSSQALNEYIINSSTGMNQTSP